MTRIRRREVLRAAGIASLVGLAGCTTGGGGQSGETNDLSGPVPEEYRTATSIGGLERDPEQLYSKSGVSYQSEPKNGHQCANCVYYIPDKNGDGLGACTKVKGDIEPDGWCRLYRRYQSD